MTHDPDQRPRDTGTVDADNPWPGLAAFREADERFFHGREAVVAELARMVLRTRLTVLHGVSGLGKTSLLRAGLFPRLRREHLLPVYVRLSHADESAPLSDQVRDAITRGAGAAGIEAPPADRIGTLWEYFHRKDALFWDARNRVVTPLLVFDQFEEIFTLGRGSVARRARSDAFLSELSDLVEGRPAPDVRARLEQTPEEALGFSAAAQPFKLLLSLREDFLPDLAELRGRMPSITQAMFRLQPMTTAEALRVVEVAGGHLVEHAVAERIVGFVASARSEGSLTAEDAIVEPALLSVFCRELNNKRRAQGRATITGDLLEGSRTAIITDFYERTISEGGLDPAVRIFVEERLLTESGFRDTVAEEHALRTPGVTAADVELLIARRLLRREDTSSKGRARLELTHDVLADAVRVSRDRRRALETQQREMAARLAREERARRDAEAAAAREQERREFEAAQALAAKERENATLAQALALQEQQARGAAERLARTRQHQLVWLAVLIIGTSLLASYAWRQAELATTEQGRANRALAAAYVDRVARGEPWPLAYLARAIRYDADALPARALLLGLLTRQVLPVAEMTHGAAIERIAFTGDATRVFAMANGSVSLWDARTGQPIGSDLTRGGPATAAALSADGQRALTASADGLARIFDTATGEPIGEPFRHERQVSAAAFDPNGARIVTAEVDGALRVWDIAAHTPRVIASGQDSIVHVSFDPTGRLLLGVTRTGMLSLWEIASGRQEAALEVAAAADEFEAADLFSPDGSRVLAVLLDGTVRVLDTRPGGRGIDLRDDGPIVSASFAPDGNRILTTSLAADQGAVVHLWDARTGDRLPAAIQHADWISTASFSPDGEYILTASHDRTARVWSAATGEPASPPLQHARRVVQASFSPDGSRVLTASDDGTAQIWAAGTGLSYGSPMRHTAPLTGASFSRDGTLVLTAARDRTARVWDARTGVPVDTRVSPGEDFRLELAAFSADGTRLVTAGSLDPGLPDVEREQRRPEEYVARLWDAATAQPVGELAHGGRLKSVAFSPAGVPRLVTASADHTARLWDARTGEPLGAVLQHQGPVFQAAFSQDGSRVVTASEDGTARVWDTASGDPLGAPLRHPGFVLSAAFSPDGTRVLTACADRTIRLWDPATGAMAGDITGSYPTLEFAGFDPRGDRILGWLGEYSLLWDARTLAQIGGPIRHEDARRNPPIFSPDGAHLVTTAPTGTRIWDVRRDPVLAGELPNDAAILSAAFSADGRLATGSEDGLTRLWDVRTREQVGIPLPHPAGVSAMTFRPDGARLLTLTDDGSAHIWDVPAGTPEDAELLARLAEAIGGHEVAADGSVVRIEHQWSELAGIRSAALQGPAGGHSADAFAHWLFADPETRTISPLSRITVPEQIAQFLAQGEPGRREAARLFPGHRALVVPGERLVEQAVRKTGR